MKKFFLICGLVVCLFLIWCWDIKLLEWESIYEWELTVSWVWPNISFDPIVEEWTLVLIWSYEDHTDHIFLNKWTWEKYFEKESDYLPWNIVKFKWIVEILDWAAGNHYYNVKNIDVLKLKNYPNVWKIGELFDAYSYCEIDSDCGYLAWECPLWCYIPLNVKYIDIASNVVSNFINHLWDERCIYDCIFVDKVVCKNYKCEMIDSEIEEMNKTIACTPEERSAEFCTMQYEPVCGSDFRTYWNSCLACQSETVESYTKWECENSAFAVEWDSKYLREVEEILNKDWAVTCDLFYTNFGRQVHSLFMADYNRFYSEMDDYSDNYSRNQVYTLAIDWKTYYRSTFPDSDNIVENSSIDVESQIASLLVDTWKNPDFQMNCSGWIENEILFNIPEFFSWL